MEWPCFLRKEKYSRYCAVVLDEKRSILTQIKLHRILNRHSSPGLFQQHHPPRLLILLRPQLDKVDAAGDGLADFIASVPVGGAGSLLIDSGGLVAQVEPLDHSTTLISIFIQQ